MFYFLCKHEHTRINFDRFYFDFSQYNYLKRRKYNEYDVFRRLQRIFSQFFLLEQKRVFIEITLYARKTMMFLKRFFCLFDDVQRKKDSIIRNIKYFFDAIYERNHARK